VYEVHSRWVWKINANIPYKYLQDLRNSSLKLCNITPYSAAVPVFQYSVSLIISGQELVLQLWQLYVPVGLQRIFMMNNEKNVLWKHCHLQRVFRVAV
jgi:hypothetical protein